VGVLLVPETGAVTAMVTTRLCVVVMLPEAGATPTVGVIAGADTVTEAVPEELL
jgi:hypothetical protein